MINMRKIHSYSIIQMNQSYEQKDDQCFIPAKWEEQTEYLKRRKTIEVDVSSIVQQILPNGNQLHHKARPTNLAPRTCFPEVPMYLLPPELNEPSINTPKSTLSKGTAISFELPFPKAPAILSEQFAPPFYKCIYNKLSLYKQKFTLSQQDASRYKNTTFLNDYNEKLFPQLKPQSQPKASPHQDEFCSNFECGNLGAVFQRIETQEKEYYLLLENDVNSLGYTNWFFFRIKNVGTGKRKFHIVNMSKNSGLLNKGMKFSVFSTTNNREKNEKWIKGGQNALVYLTNFVIPHKPSAFYSCLYFEYTFQHENDEVYFAQTQPYTYSRLINVLSKLDNKYFVQPSRPIYSISNNIIPIINFDRQNIEKKKTIVFLGRQHPAETVGSFTIEGVLEELMSQSPQSKFLRDKYQIVVIPMVNPDGVIHGNSRCNISGLDLNRQWIDSNLKQFTPETVKLKKYLLSLHQQSQIAYTIDMHGHSKKYRICQSFRWNSFFFCCKFADKLKNFFFPIIMSRLEKKFDFYSCTYGIGADKINTIRGQLHDLGIKQCYTLQTSYYGYIEEKQIKLFDEKDLKGIGKSVIKGLYLLLSNNEQLTGSYQDIPSNLNSTRNSLQREISKDIDMAIQINKQIVNTSDMQSDSDPEGDILDFQERINFCQSSEKIKFKRQFERKSPKKQSIQRLKTRKRSTNLQRKTHESFQTSNLSRTTKNHKSEKKLPSQTVKRSITPIQMMPTPSLQRKFPHESAKIAEKKNSKIEASRPRSQQRPMVKCELKVLDQEKKNVCSSIILKHPCYWINGRSNDKKNSLHNRIKTEIMHQFEQNKSKGHIIKLKSQYQYKDQIKQPNLIETLSIKKVSNEKREEKKLETSENTLYQNELSIQYRTQPPQKIQDQKLEENKKESMRRNFQEQLNKRKKSLHKKFQDKKYQKFERFSGKNTITKKSIPQAKQQNSIFYYFPIL